MFVPPVYVLEPLRTSVPVPFLVIPALPVSELPMVAVFPLATLIEPVATLKSPPLNV